jgi:DNA repair protein RadC
VPGPAACASALAKRFGTLSELLCAEATAIAAHAGTAAAGSIKTARALMVHAAAEELRPRKSLATREDVARFLRTLIGFRSDECLVVLFLNSARGLIDHEIVATGSPASVEFDLRRILLLAIGRGASAIIVAHNHPSGNATPSGSDMRLTRELAHAARVLGVRLEDHLVVAGDQVQSAQFVG